MVGPPGLEPGTKGFNFMWFSPLIGLCLHHIKMTWWVPSSLYTFLKTKAWLGVAMLKSLGFAEFDTIPYKSFLFMAHNMYESSALTN